MMNKASLMLMAAALVLSACDETSDQQQARQQENVKQQAVNSVGMPAIHNFSEMRMMKQILELRDQNVATTTYYLDMNGHRHKLCDSVGFGLPYATQFTNPQRITQGGHVIAQADPNGLFSPAAADGTWILCVDPRTKQPKPLYVEPRVIVTPFELPPE